MKKKHSRQARARWIKNDAAQVRKQLKALRELEPVDPIDEAREIEALTGEMVRHPLDGFKVGLAVLLAPRRLRCIFAVAAGRWHLLRALARDHLLALMRARLDSPACPGYGGHPRCQL